MKIRFELNSACRGQCRVSGYLHQMSLQSIEKMAAYAALDLGGSRRYLSVACPMRGETVVEPAAIKYRSFLSYAHADVAWARWLHTQLERFAIDKDLVGRVTAHGAVPEALRPIFRDREDFSGGHSLADATVAAIDASAALIVLCSPISASRPIVNEEVRLFRARHPDRPVIPVIIAGAWPDNFPPALRVELNADGSLSDRPVTVLAPDLREAGDGKSLGLAKVVAGLTGLAPDDVYRRAERARRQQSRLRSAFAAIFVAVISAGGFFYWQSRERQATLAEVAALVDKYSLITPAQAAAPGTREGLTHAITAIAEGSATDPRYASALELLKAGKPAEAEPLLRAVAEEKSRRAEKDARDAAAAYRNLGSIAALSEPGRARDYFAEAARLDPSDIDGNLLNALFQHLAGQLDSAQSAYTRALAIAKPGQDDRSIYWAKLGIGDIQQQRGRLAEALATYREASAMADRLAKAYPGSADWQNARWASYQKIGEVLQSQGDLASAFSSYNDGLAVQDRLAEADPENNFWQYERSQSYDKVGDVQEAQGDLAGALASYQKSLAIREPRAEANPDNTLWQIDLSASYDKVGDVQKAQGDVAGAFMSYRNGLAIRERLARADPDNRDWQRDLSISMNRVGDLQKAQVDLADALITYRDSLAIADRLAKTDPSNTTWQRDLSIATNNIGDVQLAQGDLAGALISFRNGLAISDRLAKTDPANAGWQNDLSISLNKVGDVLMWQGDLAGALASYRDGLAIADKLGKADPGNSGWQRDLSVSLNKVGDVQQAQHDLAGALTSYRASLAIADRLAKADPGNAGWQRDLAACLNRLGDVQMQQGDFAGAFTSYRNGYSVADRLAKADPANPAGQYDLWVSLNKVGDAQLGQRYLAGALNFYRGSLAVANRQVDADSKNANWQNNAAASWLKVATALELEGENAKALDSLTQGRTILMHLTMQFPNNEKWKNDLALFDRQIAALPR